MKINAGAAGAGAAGAAVAVVAVVAVVGFAMWMERGGCSDRPIYAATRAAVTNQLVSPASAVFPAVSAVTIETTPSPLGGCNFVVRGFVDSQNRASALVRSDYTARGAAPASGSPRVISVTVTPR